MEELECTFLEERQRWGETIIALARDDNGIPITIKTTAEEGDLKRGLVYRFYGQHITHWKYGRQFHARTWLKIEPHGGRGVLAYLQQAPGIGPATAKAIYKACGADSVKSLREDPDAVVDAVGSLKVLNVATAYAAAEVFRKMTKLEHATIDCLEILKGRGFPKATIRNAISTWGNRAAEMIRRNPYLLMRFPGCGFSRSDSLYLESGGRPDRLKRQTLCVWNEIEKDGSGDTWHSAGFVTDCLTRKIGSTRVRPVSAIQLGRRAGLLTYRKNGGGRPWIAGTGQAQAELSVADHVAYMLEQPADWPELDSLDVSDHQREQLAAALKARIAVFSGSPGTGKTYSAARLIAKIKPKECAVVAPTGKAAVRITEALAAYGLELKAKTIHSYLGVVEVDAGGRWTFEHGRDLPVEEKYVVVDEASMLDTDIMAALLDAMRPDGHLLLVGDVNQLPPVGHGAPLRDLTAAGVPTGDLREIRRNAGLIVETCRDIREEKTLTFPRKLHLAEGRNLIIRVAKEDRDIAEEVVSLVDQIRVKGRWDPVWQTQVIVAVNEKSETSRVKLNARLQELLNRKNRCRYTFWREDKIICLKNQLLTFEGGFSDLKEQVYVANGEQGQVVDETPTYVVAEFKAPDRRVRIPKGKRQEVPGFSLGYAITAHKSQGSEWPCVIVALDPSHGARFVADRSWIYTAISRAKEACILVGQEKTIRQWCRTQKINRRKTFLVELLTEEKQCKKDVPVASTGKNGNQKHKFFPTKHASEFADASPR